MEGRGWTRMGDVGMARGECGDAAGLAGGDSGGREELPDLACVSYDMVVEGKGET
jgi:hypothetical protein